MIRIPPQRGGWLEVICGPMFSGKSEEMIRRLRRAEIAGQRVVIFKPQIDDRYDATDVVSHAGARMRAVPDHVGRPRSRARAQGFDVVGIDEVQFLGDASSRMRSTSRTAASAWSSPGSTRTSGGSRSGRCRSSSRTPSSSTSCRPSATAAAVRRRRHSGSSTAQPAPYSGETVVVGAAEQYEARCRGCHEAGVGAALVAA